MIIFSILNIAIKLTLCADMEGHAWDGFVWVDGWPMTPPRRQQDQQDQQDRNPQPDQIPVQRHDQQPQPTPTQPMPVPPPTHPALPSMGS